MEQKLRCWDVGWTVKYERSPYEIENKGKTWCHIVAPFIILSSYLVVSHYPIYFTCIASHTSTLHKGTACYTGKHASWSSSLLAKLKGLEFACNFKLRENTCKNRCRQCVWNCFERVTLCCFQVSIFNRREHLRNGWNWYEKDNLTLNKQLKFHVDVGTISISN